MVQFQSKLKNLPPRPGVYLYKNSAGEIIYVGKAKNLRKRVRSPRVFQAEIADLDYFLVSNEVESLILENNLIKQYHPRYNVDLRDDKNYQFIKIDFETQIPQIYTVRKITRGRAKYFGPYTSALAVRHTLRLIENVFRLCRNKKITGRPCFAYHLKRCPGVCAGEISLAEYRHEMDEISEFLKHRQGAVLADLKKDMKEAARKHNFEYAALLRDKLRALLSIWERQKIVSPRKENEDYLGLHVAVKEAIVNVFPVREGKLLNQEHFTLSHDGADETEILERFIVQYYQESSDVPRSIFVPVNLPDSDLIETALSKLRKTKVQVARPTRGRKAKLLALANENARAFYERERVSFAQPEEMEILEALQTLLDLPKVPERIECYDISNIQGTNPVGSMVVFTQGRPDKSQYRKFKINTKETPDDFAMMREILARRFKRREDGWPLPDLIIIDGGKGQLNIALREIPKDKFQIPIIGLAKRLEEIFVPGKRSSIMLPQTSPILFLLQRVRDEAHRFAITFHRHARGKEMTRSRLDDIPGIGPVLKKKLLQKFGSVAEIKKTSLEELAEVVGNTRAHIIKEQLT